MRTAIFSDVHSNLEALEAVLKEIREQAPDRLLFLGDAIGYGPDPNECVERIFEVADQVVAGNHDHAGVGLMDVELFNPPAKQAILWTQSVLTEANRQRILSMPYTARQDDLFLVHACPHRPDKWSYIFSFADAAHEFDFFEGKICLIGHTHRPALYYFDGTAVGEVRESMLTFQENVRYIVNAGSVGQPRDSNSDAVYVLHDTKQNSLTFNRVKYNLRITQDKMKAEHLPTFLIKRLAHGA